MTVQPVHSGLIPISEPGRFRLWDQHLPALEERTGPAATSKLPNEWILIDEVFTPDSSRFWPTDHLQSQRAASGSGVMVVSNGNGFGAAFAAARICRSVEEERPAAPSRTSLENPHPFRPETFGSGCELLFRASHHEPQPSVLLITCADAGLLAERLTENNPDEFCFGSGLGTHVPPARAVADSCGDSLVATLEYAVRVLRVRDIVVCGHSRCCALAALLRGSLPGATRDNQARWLQRTAPLRELIQSRYARLTDNAQRQRAAELETVLVSLENLSTHPCVRERLDEGTLRLQGWFFNTATGELLAYNPAAGQFQLLMTFAEGRRA